MKDALKPCRFELNSYFSAKNKRLRTIVSLSLFSLVYYFPFLQAKKINPNDGVKPIIMTSVTNNSENLDPTIVDFKNITSIFKLI